MRIGILGTGNMGKVHAAAYKKMSGVEIVGIVGRDKSKTREVASKFGARPYFDPLKLLDDDTIGAVDVCYPTFLHKEFVIAALERKKHVFCETPISLNLDDANAMIKIAESHKRIFMVALLLRFVPERIYIRKAIKSGKLGKPLSIVVSKIHPPYWPKGGSLSDTHYGEPVIELLAFEFDYLNWLFGMPRNTSAVGVTGSTNTFEHMFSSLKFDTMIGFVEGNALVPRDFPLTNSIRVVCEDGILEANTRFVGDGPPESKTVFYPKGRKAEIVKIKGSDPYEEECRYFFECVEGKGNPSLLSPEAARDAVRVALATRKSLQRGRSVRIT